MVLLHWITTLTLLCLVQMAVGQAPSPACSSNADPTGMMASMNATCSAIQTFDQSLSPEQKAGLGAIAKANILNATKSQFESLVDQYVSSTLNSTQQAEYAQVKTAINNANLAVGAAINASSLSQDAKNYLVAMRVGLETYSIGASWLKH